MRIMLAVFLLLSAPTSAWEFTPGIPCVLTHQTDDAEIELTYDPTVPIYTITIRRESVWQDGAVFSMQFDGPRGLEISTNRHGLSQDKRSLTVADRGFGNVLDGLQFNESTTATLGQITVTASLADAREPVAAFRLCQPVPGV